MAAAVLGTTFFLAIFLGLPTLTYFYAKHLGRNAWAWFFIGCLLPGIATIILSLLPDLSGEKKGDEKQTGV